MKNQKIILITIIIISLGLNNCSSFRNLSRITHCKTAECLNEGENLAMLSIGTIAENVTEAINLINSKSKIAHYDMRFIKPLDEDLLHQICIKFKNILTVEDGTIVGGFGSAVLEFAAKNNYSINIHILGIPDEFIEHGRINELQHSIGLGAKSLVRKIEELL